MKKICRGCNKELDITCFYSHPAMADGHLNKCKECVKKIVKARRVLNIEKVREYDRKRSKTQKRKIFSIANNKKWITNNPEKYKAHNALNNAVRDGKIIKPLNCEICGAPGLLHAHHFDYSQPLLVIWLCPVCHGAM